jgi:hypothetical protein
MSDEKKSVDSQWSLSPDNNKPKESTTSSNSGKEPPKEKPKDKDRETEKEEEKKNQESNKHSEEAAEEKSIPDTMKRRGFFEAIKSTECPQKQLTLLLKEHEEQAKEKIQTIEALAEKRIEHLQQRITLCEERITELREKLSAAEQYRETTDEELQSFIKDKEAEEQLLLTIQQRLTDVRVELGKAKSGIIDKSLEEAEKQVTTALNIQKTIYDETRLLNRKKFEDEKDQLALLSKCYKELYDYYEVRYKKVNKHLAVLDVDGISPVTTQVLVTIGSISFGAAGFFFSTFAGRAGFGNEDMLFFVLGGIINTAQQPGHGLLKILILIGLIALVTGISLICNYLINRLKKKSEEEIRSEVMMGMATAKKLEQFQYQASVKSNNWYAFWLQLIPGIFIAGLIILGISKSDTNQKISSINASSEGLIIGTCIAMSLAGLIYFYIIKIVEPRLVKQYDSEPDTKVNWIRSNWELVAIIIAFIIFSVCIIAIPYTNIDTGHNIIPFDQQTRYAILLFITICFVGGVSFAYSIRSRGLIETNDYLERVMQGLNSAIGYCSSAEAPELHNRVAEEHSNITQHVLRQLTFKATIIGTDIVEQKKQDKEKGFWEGLMEMVKGSKNEEKPAPPNPIHSITFMEPWEERYFPHILDELKAIEFEYMEQKSKTRKAEDRVNDYKENKVTEKRIYEKEIEQSKKNRQEYEEQIENTIKEKNEKCLKIKNAYNKTTVDLLDGFHLGLWYRENGIGPKPDFFDTCTTGPVPSSPINIISAQ